MTKYLRMAATIALCLLAVACGDDDDGVMERPDYTSIKCQLTLGGGWLKLYEVTAEYLTADGRKQSELIGTQVWEHSDKADGRYTQFKYKVTARAKYADFDLSDSIQRKLVTSDQDLTYAHEFYYYEKVGSAHNIKKKDEGVVVAGGKVAEYIAQHQQIVLFDEP